MKKHIIIILVLTLICSIICYLFFNTSKIYKENWNIYISNPHKTYTKVYQNNLSTSIMTFNKKAINNILNKNNFKEINEDIFEIYEYISEEKLKAFIKENISKYNYYLLLKKEDKFDLLLLNDKNKEILSVNNCMYLQ